MGSLLVTLRRIFCCGQFIELEEAEDCEHLRDGYRAIPSDMKSSYYHGINKAIYVLSARDADEGIRKVSTTDQVLSENKGNSGRSSIIVCSESVSGVSGGSKSSLCDIIEPIEDKLHKPEKELKTKRKNRKKKKETLSSNNSSGGGDFEEQTKAEVEVVQRKIKDYCSSQKILLVGEGDFSFSACLAKAFGSASNMTSTSLDSEAYLSTHYKYAMLNVRKLQTSGCKVIHEVDATDMANHMMIQGQTFDVIIYNFPHTGDFGSANRTLRKHKRLVRLFMQNAVKLIKNDGQVHIRHKSYGFFLKWNLKLMAPPAGLVLIEEAPFDKNDFNCYFTKYGFDGVTFHSDDNFDCHTSKTYKFGLSKRQKKVRRREINGGPVVHEFPPGS